MYRLLFVVFCFAASGVLAQEASYFINPTQLDHDLLSRTLEDVANRTRKENGLRAIAQDSTLAYVARYLMDNTPPGKFTERKKLEVLLKDLGGAGTTVDEHRFSVRIHEPVNDFAPIPAFYHLNTTYQSTVSDMIPYITGGRKRVGVLTSNATSFGAAFAYDSVKRYLICIVIFATDTPSSTFITKSNVSSDQTAIMLPEYRKRYDRKMRYPRNNKNQDKATKWIRAAQRSGMRDGVQTSFKLAKKTFRPWHFRSGLAFESRPVQSFSSETTFHAHQSRLNQRSMLNSDFKNFLSGRKLLKDARRNFRIYFKSEPFKLLGFIPTPFNKPPTIFFIQSRDYIDVAFDNLLLFRRGRLAYIAPAHPFPSAPKRVPYPLLPYTLPITTQQNSRIAVSVDTVKARVYYKRGEITPDEDEITSMLEQIPIDRKVKHIRMVAYASIEGTAEINTKLFEQRGEALRKILGAGGFVNDSVTLHVTTQENWKLYFEQAGLRDAAYATQELEQVRKSINKQLSDTIVNAWLDSQRYGEISLILEKSTVLPITADSLVVRFKNTLAKTPKNQPGKFLLDLSRIQRGFYYLLDETGEQTRWSELFIPGGSAFVSLRFNAMLYRLHAGLVADKEFFRWMQENGFAQPRSKAMTDLYRFNARVYVANHYFGSKDLENNENFYYASYRQTVLDFRNTKKVLKDEPDSRPLNLIMLESTFPLLLKQYSIEHPALYHEARRFYIVEYLNIAKEMGLGEKTSRVKRYLTELWNNYLSKETFSDDETIEWALFLNLWDEPTYAERLLARIVKRAEPNHYGVCLYLSIQQHLGALDMEQQILDAAKVLTDAEWIDLLNSRVYLHISFLESLPIRMLYQQKLSSLNP